MKILKLEFENINNLKGNHAIDFTAKPLVDADIFAIIGATGSGKSTLLDVITLALFNRTPRFKKVSKSSLSNEGSIITRNEKKASAKITYLAGGKEYISVWNIKYTNRNTLGDYHMEIWKDGVPLDLHRGNVPKENEKIIGLDYEQFTKAIILSQGEFSKFLKADHNERSVLLEKITGTSIYRDIGVKAFEIQREKKSDLEKKEEVLSTIKLLSEQDIKELKAKQAKLKKDLEQDKKSLEETQKKLKQKEDFNKVEKRLKSLENQQKENLEEIKLFGKEQSRLSLHKKVVPFRKELIDFSKKNEAIIVNKNRLKQHKEKLATETKRKTDVIAKQQSIIKEEITSENFIFENGEFEKKVNKLIFDLNYIKQDGKKQTDEIEEIIKLKDLVEFQFAVTTKPEIISLELTKIEELLKQQNYELTSDVLAIEKDKNSIEKKIQDFKKLINYKEQSKEVEKDIKENSTQIFNAEKLLESFPEKITPIKKEEGLLNLNIQMVEIEQKIASFEEHRKDLNDGEQCPLCGSQHHPFENKHQKDDEKLSVKLNNLKTELERNKSKLADINTQKQLLKAKVETYKNNIIKYKSKLESLKIKAKNDLQNKGLFDEVLELNLSGVLLILENKKRELETILRVLQKVEPLKRLKNKLKKRLELLNYYKKVESEKNKLFKGENISEVMNKLQNTFNEASSNIVLHQNDIKREKQVLKDNQIEFQELHINIELVKQKTKIQEIEELQKAILSDTIVSRIENEQQILNNKHTEIGALLKKVEEDFEKLDSEEIQKINLEVIANQKIVLENKYENNIGEISAITERLKSDEETARYKKTYQKDLDKTRKEFARWDTLNKLIGDGTGKKFSSFAQGLTLKQLIAFTNKRLKSFSGRYLLYSEPVKQELMIIDTLQGNTERSVKTLSGGETFLVSLALALSLSDMASKNVQLESLFIDEGFGTLDEDTLENALNLLEKLQSESNKTVGVISHVKELKERISVQIRMQKDSLGHSVLEVVG